VQKYIEMAQKKPDDPIKYCRQHFTQFNKN
jgi:hypothetical protein